MRFDLNGNGFLEISELYAGLKLAGPAFDASLAMEFLDMTGPDVAEGVAAVRERRAPDFG